MSKIYYYMGLPGSGKTTLVKQRVKESNGNLVRVNKDDLREMMFNSKFSKDRERQVLNVRDFITKQALREGKDVAWDDTNFKTEKHLERAKEIASGYEADVEVKYIDTSVYECIERNRQREKPVPENVIWTMYRKYVQPKEVEYNPHLEDCILVDIDGTLANHEKRSPFEYHKCLRDKPNEGVVDLVKSMSKDYEIIILTGRENITYDDSHMFRTVLDYTKEWLRLNSVPYHEIFIRSEGDHRKDYIIKKELYEKNIKDKYNVKFVVDDRWQVVKMWRELGLTVFDVKGWGI